MLPNEVKDWNLFIDGLNYSGRIDEITLPTLTRKTEEYFAGGMIAPVELDMGMEKLEMDFTLREYNPEVLAYFADPAISAITMRCTAVTFHEGSTNTNSVEIVFRGRWRSLEQGTLKRGESATLKVGVALAYYKYSHNGTALIEIDPVNYIETINGVDRAKARRTALGM